MAPPAGLALLERIQAQMRAVARRLYDAVPVPPFTLFFHATDALPYFNYAIPDGPAAASGNLAAPLELLEAEFHARRRVPRFEFVEACAPRLGKALQAHGFALENRAELMVCPRGEERTAPAVSGLDVATLDSGTALGEFVTFLDVQRRAFGLPAATQPSDENARSLRETLSDGLAFLARIAGEPVATAMIQPPHDGLTELVGVSTLEKFRRRGIGGFLSFAAVRAAFDRGVSLAFLSAADARAGRVYEGAGFSPAGHSLFYSRPPRDP
ncbi:MAG: GNAT family N-acetyltransferase [Thermoanaerobaculia bacterium]